MASSFASPRAYLIRVYSRWYQIDFLGDDGCTYDSQAPITSLWISRPNATVSESSTPLTVETPLAQEYADAILGLININRSLYLNVVVAVESVADVSFDEATAVDCRKSTIYRVKRVNLFPIDNFLEEVGGDDVKYDDPVLLGEEGINSSKSQWDGSKSPVALRDSGSQSFENDQNSGVIKDISDLLTTGHYFSRSADLTRSLQRQWEQGYVPLRPRRFATLPETVDATSHKESESSPRSTKSSETLFDMADPMFNWSKGMSHDIPSHWLTPLIQGYVGYMQQLWNQKNLQIMLIGRRCVYRSGTRLNARGIDVEGHVGNFVESELRIRVDQGSWKSFVQIRGSVPVFWGQRNIFAHPYFTRPINESEQAFLLHYRHLQRLFGEDVDVCMLTLLDNKASEIFLLEAIDHLNHTFDYLPIHLVKYNYNVKVKWSSVVPELISFVNTNLLHMLQAYGYFDGEMMSRSRKAVLRQQCVGKRIPGIQSGVLRVNCLDCLDRTNAMQLMVAWVWLANVLDPSGASNMLDHDHTDHDFSGSLREFRDMWCNHGDNVSLLHSGTESVYTQHIREGRQSYGALFHYTKTMVNRACSVVFNDEARQASINILLNIVPKDDIDSPTATESVTPTAAPENADDLVVWCGTWNMNGASLSKKDNIGEWVTPGLEAGANMFVFCLQEFVELSVLNVLSGRTEENKEILFNGKVLNILNDFAFGRGVRFVHLKSCSMVGLYLTVFVSEKLRPTVRDLVTTYVKTGFNGNVGNKGAVGIRFNMGGQSISLIDVHLNSGKLPQGVRISELDFVIRNLFQEHGEYSLLDDDLFVLGGDFNFHIVSMDDLGTTEVFKQIYGGNISVLLEDDEFLSEIKHPMSHLRRIREATITFEPTYKFKKGTDFYEVKRTPAWCDRILYGGNNGSDSESRVRCLSYRRHEKMVSSDHKAVSALFELYAKKRQVKMQAAISLIDL
ncbi:endonuclease/exonuclease/phosphatase family protein [Babesia bovis T2Bo]|uniref:phosphoinositide 5-phosphatase n=1 Tax=Babesia bovis TaxID=5865 RepID=A7ASJ0_BABBO|nr:endonuclease/exonuclease/phosphatase family protein [Babesia bovis T2Bo]EDO07509.1 endonuclease/exonuclease/phosphatase family protein [Babesia bovis T2Bo]|eukprot:XP_001611077.1 endonuclease/exonuclease/phosphatase family protein [Babesia bovis T2Bo]